MADAALRLNSLVMEGTSLGEISTSIMESPYCGAMISAFCPRGLLMVTRKVSGAGSASASL